MIAARLLKEAEAINNQQIDLFVEKVRRALWVVRDKRIALYPADDFKVTYSISFDHPLLHHQARTLRVTEESFVEEIAPARTFGFLKEVELLRQHGLALGGSLDNAIVLTRDGLLSGELRFPDEFARHKALDLIGDLALVGRPLKAHVIAHKGGHALHTALVTRLLRDRSLAIETTAEPAQVALADVSVPVAGGD